MEARKAGSLWVSLGVLVLLVAGCGSSTSSGAAAAPRSQTKLANPAQVIDGHAKVLPSGAEGGTTACPPDYKACGDGGCCPSSGVCTDGFTCDAAPTACTTCASGATGGRCCQGNCCEAGATCSSAGLCHTKRAEAKVPCSGAGTSPCGTSCCPAGSACRGDVCEIHGGTAPVCATGEALCDDGSCCPVGYQCSASASSSYPCEKTPDAPSVSTVSGTCSTGDTLILPKGGNCPAVTSSNSSYLYAMCCPTGSKLYCRSPSSSFDPQPTCLVAPTAVTMLGGSSCASPSMTAIYDSSSSTYVCCPYDGSSYPSLSDIDGNGTPDCYYSYPSSPSCSSGSTDPATGKCCSGSISGGNCCPSGTSACGTGCCSYSDSCSADGLCQTYTTDTPTCPTTAARRCPQNDGTTVCCGLDTTCGDNGSCSCPLSANVDCGSFCATDSSACGCPSDHPEVCGGSCCLAGGCNTFVGSSSPPTCGCPADATSCGSSGLCCPNGTTCGSAQGVSGCFKCPADAPTLCGQNCCSVDDTCVDGECIHCPAATPHVCGSTCCADNESCVNGTCHAGTTVISGTGGSTSSGEPSCSAYTQVCTGCSFRVCVSNSGSNCSAYYETSSGSQYTCSSCSGCASAAQQFVQSCCGTATATP